MNGQRLAVLRADASVSVGTGHVARCLTLADDLAAQGWDVMMACAGLPGALRDDILLRGFGLLEIPASVALLEEPALIHRALGDRAADLTVIDHYGIGTAWHRAARLWTDVMMVIDDLAMQPADADLLLNQNLGETVEAYASLVAADCKLLIGPHFALLRPQFERARRAMRERRDVSRLLVFLSGSDENDMTAMVARAAARLAIAMDVVVGSAYPHWERMRSWAELQPQVTLHRNVADMGGLMSAADLAIGAPSSASWERCCVGLPSILITLADNQRRAASALAKAGAAVDLGWYEGVDEQLISAAITTLTRSPVRLAEMSRSAASITDGLGTHRVRREIMRLFEGGSAGE